MMSYLQVLPAPTTAPSATASSSSTDGGSISEDALIIIIVLGGVAGILLCALIAAGWRLAGRSLLVTDRAGPLEVDVV